jgi:hypothetical protein
MAMTYRISLWSGGKIARGWIVSEPPIVKDGVCEFTVDQGGERNRIVLMGTVSVEEGHWERTTVRAAETHQGGSRLSY